MTGRILGILPKEVSKSVGQYILAAIVFTGLMAGWVILLAKSSGGAIHPATVKLLTAELFELYLPLLGIMAAFLFSRGGKKQLGNTGIGTLSFAAIVTGFSCLSPLAIMLVQPHIEEVSDWLVNFDVWGGSLAAMAIAYYYSK